MATASDVASMLVERCGTMPAAKIHRLLYFAQGWHMAWEGRPLFSDRIDAWANGPVVPSLWGTHQGKHEVGRTDLDGDGSALDAGEAESVAAVLGTYGGLSAHELSVMTHREPPWISARRGLAPMERGTSQIQAAVMAEHFSALRDHLA